ncbi:MAG: hypothetical protein Q8R82_16600 [Hyphomonadaceae bacterium]|nr:hypothetical protein [Hyphomonadaceae bacterium]
MKNPACFAMAACIALMTAIAPQAFAQQATAEKPVMCWDYNTLADGAGSRFGIRSSVDDQILSRAAYYTVNKLKAKVNSPLAAGVSTWFKLELRAEAEGVDAPVALSGLLVELENPIFSSTIAGEQSEVHVDDSGKVMQLRLVPLEARFKAADTVVSVPFKSQGPDIRRQDVEVRLGAYSPPSRRSGEPSQFDPKATLPLIAEIDAAWRKAGSLMIEFALADSGAAVATSDALPYIGEKAAAEFVKMNGRASQMISGGKCRFLTD